MNKITILIILILLTSCAATTTTTTTKRITTSTLPPTTTSTTTTSTSSTTTTTFTIPNKGKLCAKLYGENLNNICGTTDISFFVVAPEYAKCALGAREGANEIIYIQITDYNVAPYKGIAVEKSPIFTLTSNIATNEVGEISARYNKGTQNEITFVQDGYKVEVSTWKEGRTTTCTSEQTLEIAKRVSANVPNLN